MPRLLIVDDDPELLYSLERSLRSDSLDVVTAFSAADGIERIRTSEPVAVILDVRLPDMSGLDAFLKMREIDSRLPVIIITANATTETAIEAMKRGAFEYLIKPVDLDRLLEVVERAIELSRLAHVPATFDETESHGAPVDRIVGQSTAMQEVYKAVGRVASQDITVLLLGESGTGKELVARAIYQHSRRSQGPFLAINCAAIPETLLESELFGHERGAYTGADRRRIGKFEQSNHGTIFLDEIGDMSPATQAKVLRLLQEQKFERLGGDETIETDVRIIAATNQNLDELVAAGRFRQDLFYRLRVFAIELPPLRDRIADLPLLVEYFIRAFGRELGKPVRSIATDTLELLASHAWPGNVRELQSAIKYALVHATGEILTTDCLPGYLHASSPSSTASPSDQQASFDRSVGQMVRGLLESGQPEVYRQANSALDRIAFQEAIRFAHGHLGKAAEVLGISRNTLRAKLRALGMAVEKQLLADSVRAAQKLSDP
jgi:two-component system nitrogen regulation response regulator GlnG